MNKKLLVLIGLFIVGIAIYILFNQMKYTTYEEVIADMVSEDEVVKKINIENTRGKVYDTSQKVEFETQDNKIIETILDKPSDMKLKRHDKIPTWDYTITFYTDTNKRYEIILGKTDAQIGDAFYEFVSENELYQLILNNDWNWKRNP